MELEIRSYNTPMLQYVLGATIDILYTRSSIFVAQIYPLRTMHNKRKIPPFKIKSIIRERKYHTKSVKK